MKLSDTIYTTDQHKQSKNVFLIVLGTILFSIYAGLLIPVNNIGAGGALGLSLVINKLTGIKIGTAQFVLNVPLFYLGFRYIGRKFVILTGIVISVSSFLINNLPKIIPPVKSRRFSRCCYFLWNYFGISDVLPSNSRSFNWRNRYNRKIPFITV